MTSPRLDVVLAAVRFKSLDGRPYRVYALLEPALRNDGDSDPGRSAGATRAMAGAANAGGMIPEQVWDARAPSGRPGFAPGTPTLSATPLAWSHAQLVRLAWSIEAGRPVERPSVVACRYTGVCTP